MRKKRVRNLHTVTRIKVHSSTNVTTVHCPISSHVITGLRTLLWFIISDCYSFLSFSAGFATTGRRPAGFRLLPLAVEPHLQNRESSNVEGSNVVLNGVPIDTLVHTDCTVSYSPH